MFELRLNKQYQKLKSNIFPIIRVYNSDKPRLYTRNAQYAIIVDGVRLFEAKLVAVNLCKIGDLTEELVLLDSEVTKEVFINKYKDKYNKDTLMAVLILVRKDYGYQTEKTYE